MILNKIKFLEKTIKNFMYQIRQQYSLKDNQLLDKNNKKLSRKVTQTFVKYHRKDLTHIKQIKYRLSAIFLPLLKIFHSGNNSFQLYSNRISKIFLLQKLAYLKNKKIKNKFNNKKKKQKSTLNLLYQLKSKNKFLKNRILNKLNLMIYPISK